METERFYHDKYTIELIYQPFFDDSTPKSRQYKIFIRKEGIILVERYGFTHSGAIAFVKKWIIEHT